VVLPGPAFSGLGQPRPDAEETQAFQQFFLDEEEASKGPRSVLKFLNALLAISPVFSFIETWHSVLAPEIVVVLKLGTAFLLQK
jgi:hypothetical protein